MVRADGILVWLMREQWADRACFLADQQVGQLFELMEAIKNPNSEEGEGEKQ